MPLGILGGTLLATALKGLFDVGMTGLSNRYNSPQRMLKRVRKAGLPLAYMYQGKVSQQSNVPQLSIDPNLGTLNQLQGERVKEETKGKEIQNEVDEAIKNWLKGQSPEEGKTNLEYDKDSEQGKKNAESFIAKHEQELKAIELYVENNAFAEGIQLNQKREALKKATQMVKNLLAQAGLMEQLKEIRGFEQLLNSSLTEDLETLPDWISSLLKIILIATKRK